MASNATGKVMMAKFPGVCACGGTVGDGDPIDYDPAARKVVRCLACGLDIGGHAWKFKGAWTDGSCQLRMGRARGVARGRISVARWEARLTAATTEVEIAKVTKWLGRARTELADAEVEAKGRRGEPAAARPTARDIELAAERIQADDERRAREDAEEAA